MRLYLNANSRHNVGYIPDTLIISANGKELSYDIQGDVDYDNDTLNCRVKGDLFVEKNDDYEPLEPQDEKELKELLLNSDSQFVIAIYPSDDSIDEKIVANDVLEDCEGKIFINLLGHEVEKEFKFSTEFYGY